MPEVVGNSLNDPTTSLVGAIDNAVTSLVVAAWASPLPSTGTFRLRIGDELIEVGSVAGTTLGSLTRGIEGTVAATHSNGAAVSLVLTAGGLAAFVAVNRLPAGWTINDPLSGDLSANGGTISDLASIRVNNFPRSDPGDGISLWCDPDSGNVIKLSTAI